MDWISVASLAVSLVALATVFTGLIEFLRNRPRPRVTILTGSQGRENERRYVDLAFANTGDVALGPSEVKVWGDGELPHRAFSSRLKPDASFSCRVYLPEIIDDPVWVGLLWKQFDSDDPYTEGYRVPLTDTDPGRSVPPYQRIRRSRIRFRLYWGHRQWESATQRRTLRIARVAYWWSPYVIDVSCSQRFSQQGADHFDACTALLV